MPKVHVNRPENPVGSGFITCNTGNSLKSSRWGRTGEWEDSEQIIRGEIQVHMCTKSWVNIHSCTL